MTRHSTGSLQSENYKPQQPEKAKKRRIRRRKGRSEVAATTKTKSQTAKVASKLKNRPHPPRAASSF